MNKSDLLLVILFIAAIILGVATVSVLIKAFFTGLLFMMNHPYQSMIMSGLMIIGAVYVVNKFKL